ncbi:anthrone oxygenase family protein [Tunturiibacter lichenicola]|uniref:anthrone oxygenase family protein n=1 Tax=Tunturiibacter lichenicola TaxID=2051959 RepID=UPI003D9B69AE
MSSVALRYGVVVLAVVAIGLVAGTLLGSGLVGLSAKGLPEEMWTKSFQLEDALYSKAMPPLFVTSLAALFVSCFVTRGSARGLFVAATVFMLVVLIVTLWGEVPLNQQIQTWVPGAAPANWADIRDRWLANHLVRTIAGLLGFVCATVGLAKM